MPIRKWQAPEGIASLPRFCTEQNYYSNMSQQILLVSVIKFLPSLSLQKVQDSTSRYSQMCLKNKRAIQRTVWVYKSHGRTPSVTENTVPKASRVLGEAQMQTASVGQRMTQKSDKRLFQNQLPAGEVKSPLSLAQDTMWQFSCQFAHLPTLSWALAVI